MTDGSFLAFGAAGFVGFAVASSGGYLVGYRAGASRSGRLLRKAARDADRCVAEASSAIDLAGRFCEAAAGAACIAEHHAAAIVERQRRLGDVVAKLLASACRGSRPAAEIDWRREPVDASVGLPDRTAFDANVPLLAGAESPSGGVLLISLDGLDRLRRRIGDPGVAQVRDAVARLLCRTGRERDLVCSLGESDFAVLLADADPDDALRHASAVRLAFRGHPFRLGADGPEVLVTASYGFTPVLPADEPRLVRDRTEAGVVRARRWGRNRLYAYDPAAARLVQVADPPCRATWREAVSA